MHHLTTLNLPTPSSKEAERQWLAARLEEALSRQVPIVQVEPSPLSSRQRTAADLTYITRPASDPQPQKPSRKAGRPHGSTADDSALIERTKAMAALGLSRYAAARCLRIGCNRLDRLCARHGIQFTTLNAA